MSTGISITKATYGAGSKTVDVTAALSSHIKNGILNITVGADALGVEDPAPGTPKTMNVTYTINNGKSNTQSVNDGNVFYIDAPPERDADGLQILKAEYGYTGNMTDVTNAVQSHVSNGSINLKVGYKQVGIPDPNPNKVKSLVVDYSINGAKNSQTIQDGQTFQLSAPPAEGDDGKTPSQHVMSFVGVLFTNLFRFIGLFLYAVSVVSAYRFGKIFISSWVWTAAALVIPGFSFWALPIIVFWIRLFSGSDFVQAPALGAVEVALTAPASL